MGSSYLDYLSSVAIIDLLMQLLCLVEGYLTCSMYIDSLERGVFFCFFFLDRYKLFAPVVCLT